MRTLPIATTLLLLAATSANAQTATADASIDLDVVAERLNEARRRIQPNLGASAYTFSPDTLGNLPGGEANSIDQILLRAPGVAQDSFGQIHVRGEHANVQYRLNGVALPEGLSVFGQTLIGRVARSMTLMTGSLPAQYGFKTAGVVDIQTKSGATDPGGRLTLRGGSWNWLQSSIEYGGKAGPVDYFLVMDGMRNDRGLENPTSSIDARHDTTRQFHGLATLTVTPDADTRLHLLLGGFNGAYQIPTRPGQSTLGYNVLGTSTFDSAHLNERQTEATAFAVLSLQKRFDDKDVQVSLFNRTSTLRYRPDAIGDILFNGIAQWAARENVATGIQADGSWQIDDRHTLRAGFVVQTERAGVAARSAVLPLDNTGAQTSNIPLSIVGNQQNVGQLYGIYVQDEWRITPTFTLNAGLRFDAVSQFTHESQVSPRINAVWKPTADTTFHAGYARYFVPPPFAALSPTTIASLLNTSAAPETTRNDPARAERSHYFDVGMEQTLAPGLTVAIDAYYKHSTNLLDEGQFGSPIVLTAFNYREGRQTGVELSLSYDQGPWSAYGNVAYSRAVGRRISSAQYNFGAAELAYIDGAFVHLDHDQSWTGSAGATYTFNGDTDTPTRVSADLLVQSGLRASTATVPNGRPLPVYATVAMSALHRLRPGTDIRLDVLNLLDARYQIRDGSGVGVGAPQFGIRRTILAGISQRF